MSDERVKKCLTDEDVQFLSELSDELATQDHCCQASPRYWAVMQDIWYPCRYGHQDRYDMYDGECCESSDVESVAKEFVEDIVGESAGIGHLASELENSGIDIRVKSDGSWSIEIDNEPEAAEFLACKKPHLEAIPMARMEVIAHGTMFLTLRECEEHIASNAHHYDNPHPYAMTAFRAPQVEKLMEIIEGTDWSLRGTCKSNCGEMVVDE